MGILWTPLQAKQSIAFYDPNNKNATFFQPQINPKTLAVTPGNVRKYINTTNGTSVIVGDREAPPMEIKMQWDELDFSDWDSLHKKCDHNPLVYVDNNDNGYLGCLVIDQQGQLSDKAAKVWNVQASFLVIAPFDGLTHTLNYIIPPLGVLNGSNTGGYMKDNYTLYIYTTIFTDWGESAPSSGIPHTTGTSGTNTNKMTFTYTDPTNGGNPVPYIKVRLYWSTHAASPLTATFLTDIPSGQSNTFIISAPYNVYSPQLPPQTYATSYTGHWSGGQWVQDPGNN